MVQFMQFDSNGYLYVFEPGCGCLGVARKVSQGCTQEEMMSVFDGNADGKTTKFPIVPKENIHKIIPKVAASALVSVNSKRFENFDFLPRCLVFVKLVFACQYLIFNLKYLKIISYF